MPYDEVQGWFAYFKARPPGWRSDNRAYMQLASNGVEKKPEELFDSLRSLRKSMQEREALRDTMELHASKMVSSGFLGRLMQVAAQNEVDWKVEI